ncbi:DUF4349 domain-containing protein [Litorihabitans aurantiacus]|uniref:DUF4349 domain-containing protein n=1 Tax=Litorihabitans aurantiacus TaxID=1930061 RepID=A0AA37UUW4_9MICO|nr:DUF4349 domain-containing protein [Litorihabitans aurantiacus]GMA30786.1 hypothetical protein GCM10025875_07780 [Litorihabitans aurantiacus]
MSARGTSAAPPARTPRPGRTTRAANPIATASTTAALAVGLVLLAGCTGGGASDTSGVPAMPMSGDSADRAGGSSESARSESGSTSGPAAGDEAATTAPASVTTGAAAADRQVISTGWVDVVVDDPVAAAGEVVTIVEGAAGWIDSRSIVAETEDEPASATLVTRIPSEVLTATLTELDTVGDTVRSEIEAEDVTGTVQDLDARIRAKELSVERLENLLANATTNAELIEAESALTARQSELEELHSQRNRLGDQAAMSTITLELTVAEEDEEEPAVEPRGFSSGLSDGWGSLTTFVTGALVVLGVLLPWLVVAAALGGAVLLVRRIRHGRATTPVATATASPAATATDTSSTPAPEAPAPEGGHDAKD